MSEDSGEKCVGSPEETSHAQEDETSTTAGGGAIPVPPPVPQTGISILAHKLWIGNLDKRLTEQNILLFVTKHGVVVSFRYLFKAGTDVAEPRGYCFVEYSTREEAEKAKAALSGKIALGKKLAVDWAKQDPAAKKNSQSISETWDASSVSETLDGGVSTSAKIAALEAKLRQMDQEEHGFPAKRPRLTREEHKPVKRTLLKTKPNIQIVHPVRKPNCRIRQ